MRLPHDERREQLVALGLELLGRTPHDQVSIGEIARTAGISKGLLYHYFPTKSDFVVAVLRASRDELERRMAPDPSASLTLGARLDASIDAFLAYVEEHAAGYLAIPRAREGDDEAIRDVLQEGRRRRVSGMVEFGAALAGVPRAEIESPALEAAVEGWLSFCEGVVVRWLAARDLPRGDVLHLVRQNLLAVYTSVAGVDARPGPARLAEAASRLAEHGQPAQV
ncbi:MAG: TetR/AcrR family transcriptional regulator [Conexibacter sp.]|nr:TetR/AcrR family transcriptional regulator [Conexibacter sp.]